MLKKRYSFGFFSAEKFLQFLAKSSKSWLILKRKVPKSRLILDGKSLFLIYLAIEDSSGSSDMLY